MDLASLARDGVFSTADAATLGLGTRQLQTLARRGECGPLTRGWWAVGQVPEGIPRHLLLVAALRRHFAGRAWVSHYSALALKGLPVDGADLRRVHLTRIRDQQTRVQPDFTLHRAVPVGPGEAARLAVAIVQTGTVTSALSALYAADAALHRGLVTTRDLSEALDIVSRHPDTAATRSLLGHADGRHESPGETRTALVLRRLGLPYTPQVVIARDGLSYRVDFLLRDAPVVIEFDGRAKYAAGDALFAEKRREDRLRSWGYEVVRLTWADLERPRKVGDLVGAAVGRARRAG